MNGLWNPVPRLVGAAFGVLLAVLLLSYAVDVLRTIWPTLAIAGSVVLVLAGLGWWVRRRLRGW